ncbi:MAG: DNA polymerase I, partial [Bacilli bacterium]|nr:DNA polymerase I [Bacilli bacterium]
MKKIILVDGNNLLFRSYYATAYNGNFMNNSKGFPTNALFGFTNMINKIINEESPEYIIVAFDKGKTFRHEKYKSYKDGRTAMPEELKVQFPVAKEMLGYMGIKYYEIDNYEADDIIGTFSQYCNDESDYIGTIISSDKDLLQLITDDVDIKLLKQKDYIRYNKETFKEDYGIEPINIIDLKALMGDSSDNITGVNGIGEKAALYLLHEYQTIDGIDQ